MRRLIAVFSLTLTLPPLALAARTLTSSLGPVVDLGYAAYAGNSSLPGVTFYGGIPYIQPPINSLRFRPPQPLTEHYDRSINSRNGVVDARNWGPLCIQQPAVVGFGVEDCVTLNVWTPPGAKDGDKIPVYVYVHGGGYYYNSAQGFPGNDWVAKSSSPIIVVSLQYRLGLLGFLAGTAVKNDWASSANNGLLDQREGFKWVQRNIHYFGGDPNKVTIGGESSGGGAVVLHLTAYGGEANPPFRAAVIQSAGNDPFYTDAKTDECFAAVTKTVGCDSASNVMACWRKATIGAIVSAINNKPSTCKFMPIIDGILIPDLTTTMLASGHFAKVPILAGHTSHDGSIFVGKPEGVLTDEDVVAAVVKRYTGLSAGTTAKMLEVYPPPSNSTPWTTQWERAMFAFQETEFACWDYYIGNISGKPAYNYRWDAADPNLLVARGAYVGAAHTSDLFYLYMGTNSGPSASVSSAVFTPMSPAQSALATQAVGWWTNFARSLDPNPTTTTTTTTTTANASVVVGATWTLAGNGFMKAQLGEASGTGLASVMTERDATYVERCAFWRGVADEVRL